MAVRGVPSGPYGPAGFAAASALAFVMAIAAAPAMAQTFVPAALPSFAGHVAFSTGGAWVDVDDDGDLDLYVATAFGADNHDVFYRNDGADTFTPIAAPPTSGNTDTVCSTWADYDNDGWVDGFVSGLGAAGGALYRGTGFGSLALASGVGLGGVSVKGTGCAWGDYDNDGDADLVLAVLNGVLGMSGGNRLFTNQGNGTFVEVTGVPPVTTVDTHHHPTWSDFDGDGDLDLFFASGTVGSLAVDRFYRNQKTETGSATFVALAAAPLTTDTRDSQVISWADVDNDGDLDCYAINYTSVPNQLYRHDGAAFTKITTGSIVTDAGAAHGVAWGDFDNDGDLDAYVARDNLQSNRYYRNNNDGTFTSVLAGAHVTETRSNYGVAAGDYDRDGDLDLFVPTARSEGPSVLYRNDLAPGTHWLELRCVGQVSNRSGLGAKVRVKATIGGTPRWQMREIAAGTSYGGHNALDAHFGLGDAVVADSVRIEWPSGLVDVHVGVPADAYRVAREGAPIVAVPSTSAPIGERWLTSLPNPVLGHAEVRFRLESPGRARVAVYDLAGREVDRLADGTFAAGWHPVRLDAASLPGSGVYLVRLETALRTAFHRVVVVH